MKFKQTLVKHGPKILVATGIAGTIGGTFWACKNTLKLPEIIDNAKAKIEEENAKLSNVNPVDEEYTDKDNRKEITRIYLRCALDIASNYLAPSIPFIGGLVCIIAGHKTLNTRYKNLQRDYIRLSGTVTALYASIEAYRSKVRELIGEEAEEKLYHNVVSEEVEITDENGKKKKVKKEMIKDPSMYDIILSKPGSGGYMFAEFMTDWNIYCDPELGWVGHDYMELVREMKAQTEKLREKEGNKITMRDIFQRFGVKVWNDEKKTYEDYMPDWSFYIGWKNDPSNKHTDDYVLFKFREAVDPRTGEWAVGISFNPDGVILEDK